MDLGDCDAKQVINTKELSIIYIPIIIRTLYLFYFIKNSSYYITSNN